MGITTKRIYPVLSGTAQGTWFTGNYCDVEFHSGSRNRVAILQFACNIPNYEVEEVAIYIDEKVYSGTTPYIKTGTLKEKYVIGNNVTYNNIILDDAWGVSRIPFTINKQYSKEEIERGIVFVPATEHINGGYIRINPQKCYADISFLVPDIDEFSVNGKDISKDIICSLQIRNADAWEIQVIQNNKVVAKKNGTNATTCTFPPGDIANYGETIFKLIASNGNGSVEDTVKATLTAPTPSISNIQLSGLNVDAHIVCTATSTNTTSWKVEAIQNNVVVSSKAGTGAISATFKVGEIVNTGDTTFRVTGYNTWNSGYKDRNVTLKAPEAIVSNFVITGTNIDETITCTAEGSNVYSWTVQAIQNGILKASKSGTGNIISCTFSNGEINTKGSTEFKLLYANTWNNNQISQTITLNRTEPKIIAIEPNGVTANRDVIIPITWASENQQSFTLEVDGNIYTGTTAKGVNIPAGTIKSLGVKQIALSIKYKSSWGEVRADSKVVTFIATGKPKAPRLDEHTHYDKAFPTFTWVSEDEYVQYRIQVLDSDGDVVDDSDNVVGNGGSYTCQTVLSNQSTYIVRVKVKTAYGYWSDWATKTFTTDFIMANKPTIKVFSSNNSIIVNSFTKYSQPFDYCDIYRKTEHGKWVRVAHKLDNDISFKDHYVGKEKYYYKVASVSTSGGINDSDIASATVEIRNFNFVNIENLNNNIEFVGNPEVQITDVFESVSNEYAGVFAPIFEEGEHNYRIGSCSFVCPKELYDQFKLMISNSKVLMYRDCRGEKIYCKVTGNIPRPKFAQDWITISFKFVEVPFIEQDTYIGYGNTWSIFWDGTYKWDGTAFWDGDTHSETQVYDGQGNQKLVFEEGYYKWKERDVNES